MNKHINKKKLAAKSTPMFVKEQEQPDGMPKEVATELLLAAPLTGGLRRMLWAARSKYFGSDLKPVAKNLKLDARFRQSTWAQIHKWLRRANARRAECQEKYEQVHRRMVKMQEDEKNPEHQARAALAKIQLERLSELAEQIEIFRDVAEDEIKRRRDFIEGLKKVVPEFAAKLEKSLCPTA